MALGCLRNGLWHHDSCPSPVLAGWRAASACLRGLLLWQCTLATAGCVRIIVAWPSVLSSAWDPSSVLQRSLSHSLENSTWSMYYSLHMNVLLLSVCCPKYLAPGNFVLQVLLQQYYHSVEKITPSSYHPEHDRHSDLIHTNAPFPVPRTT